MKENEEISLRDLFAGQALSQMAGMRDYENPKHVEQICTRCYQFADAMLKARVKHET